MLWVGTECVAGAFTLLDLKAEHVRLMAFNMTGGMTYFQFQAFLVSPSCHLRLTWHQKC